MVCLVFNYRLRQMSVVATLRRSRAMRTTFQNLTTLGLALVVTTGAATAALAGEPHDAGFKARGMKDRDVRVTRTYAAPQAAYRSFSYAPQATVAAQGPCGNVTVAPAAVQAQAPQVNAVRRFSYEPAMTAPAPVYRNWNYGTGNRGRTGYGGDYGSKATLYK
jgi:hypothetical protein